MAGRGELTDQQARFVEEYLVDCNGAQAAIRAGYKPSRARKTASELLDVEHVQKAIQAGMDRRSRKVGVTAERVLEEIACMALYDPIELCEVEDPETGEKRPITGPQDIKLLPEQIRRAIIGWGWDKAGNFTLKLSPKTPSLDQLGRHLKLFVDQVDVNLTINLADEIARRRQQVIEGKAV